MNVSAASSASTIPSASTMPIVLTRLKLHSMREPNPMMTEMPDVMIDSPAHLMDSLRASSWPLPSLSSSLYLETMNIQ